MSGDYKWDMQCIAEELAQEHYGQEFYSCTCEQQLDLFEKAMDVWRERQCDRADYLLDREKERGM